MKTFLKILACLFGGIAVLVVAAVVAIFLANWNDLKSYAGARASDAAGRKVEIHGNLDVRIGWWPTVVAEDIDFANATWGSRPQMVHIDRLEVRFRLMSVLFGPLEVDGLKLAGLDLVLETNGKQKNWQFGAQSASATAVKVAAPKRRTELPSIRHLELTNARLTYKAPNMQEELRVRLEKLSLESPEPNRPVQIDVHGAYKNSALAVDGTLGPFNTLHDDTKPYPVKLNGRIGAVAIKVDAGIDHPLDFQGIDGRFALKGKSLSDLYDAFGLPLPKTDPFEFDGRLRKQGEVWALEDFHGRLGGSKLGGVFRVETGDRRPKIVADLTSDGLRASDFEGFWGGKHETPQAEEKHVFSRQPFSLPKLNRMDAAVKFHGKAIYGGKLDVRDVAVDLALEDGLLRLKPVEFLLGKGKIAVDMDLDTRQAVPLIIGHIRVRELDLNALLAQLGIDTKSAGSLRGDLALTLRGHSPHELAASASGRGLIEMGGGQISDLLLQLIALDLQQALGQLVSHDQVAINCFVAPMQVREGRIDVNPWLFDTTDHLIDIKGDIDLGKETLRLVMEPHPKDFSVFNTLSTIRITGDLASRKASVNKLEAVGQLVLKTLAAPFMTFLSRSIEEDSRAMSPCRALFDRIRNSRGDGTAANADVAHDIAKKAETRATDQPKQTSNMKQEPADAGGQNGADSPQAGKPIAQVQRALRRAGMDVQIDGVMGPRTEAALRLFQKSHGLQQTGVPDRATTLALGLPPAERAAGPGRRLGPP